MSADFEPEGKIPFGGLKHRIVLESDLTCSADGDGDLAIHDKLGNCVLVYAARDGGTTFSAYGLNDPTYILSVLETIFGISIVAM